MSHALHAKDNFYTYEEIRDFTNDFIDRTIINITKFIETKTKNEYTVVKRKMIVDLHQQVFQNNIAIFDIQRFLNEQWSKTKDVKNTKQLASDINNFLIETWAKVSEKNRLITYRWGEELKEFDFNSLESN